MTISSNRFILLLLLAGGNACNTNDELFRELSPDDSGIFFENRITEDESLNVLNYEYIYNGGGVGVADFNNDSLPDIYFGGNRVNNALYINKGNMKFEDVTEASGVEGQGKWTKGISLVDINNDGWMDIYACAAVLEDSTLRKNILYVNQGINPSTGQPHFTDQAAAYGLDDPSNTHMAAFFDYDNDGDLDVYLLLNDLDGTYPNEFRPIRKDGSWPNTDKLLENNYDSLLRHPVFTDVSKKAGILIEGHGLGISITDINQDGWKDIYVSNDYLSNNILYINNRNGTFTDRCVDYFKHTSKNAMGNDVADINNDGLLDIIEMDMMPADQYRQKLMHSDISYQTFQNSERFGYMYQYPRNTLQLNRGHIPGNKDSSDIPAYSEIAYLSGVAQTDWSWAPLLADVDNDGFRDLLISNGLPRDMSDMDFMAYRRNAVAKTPLEELLAQIPSAKVSNYIFRNNGNLSFSNKTSEWGWETPTFSAGMAYADFDRDGDLDVVVNNTNMPASLLENTINDGEKIGMHFIDINLKGNNQNILGLGTRIDLYAGGQHQISEQSPYRGYLSSVSHTIHFGLGKTASIDSIVVTWPNRQQEVLKNPKPDQTIEIDIRQAHTVNGIGAVLSENPWFTDITKAIGMNRSFAEIDFIDFDIQKLLPHKFTKYGPSLAIGDLNGDGLDDVVAGGSSPFYASIFLQLADGRFERKRLTESRIPQLQDDAGICLFDADKDGDLDMYIASGGAENEPQSKAYSDHFYLNDGKGNFSELTLEITNNRTAKSCIAAYDFDHDDDLDLFIGGRLVPGSYPSPTSSFLYRNDSKGNNIAFTDVTSKLAPELQLCGMVTAAVWSDADGDNIKDLLLTMDWGALTIFQNKGGRLSKVATNVNAHTGWWNSIAAADLDNDGDMDYLAGNYGYNGFIQPISNQPVKVYAGDLDSNGSYDAIFTSQRISSIGGKIGEFPISGRDEFIRQMSIMKERFPNYASYAKAEMASIFQSEKLNRTLQLHATTFQSGWFENLGGFNFNFHPFPIEAQMAPVYGMVTRDLDGDGNLDIILSGNEYGMSPALGRYDAFFGLVLKGKGDGSFKALSIAESGVHIPGNGKALGELQLNGHYGVAAVQNEGVMKFFALNKINQTAIAANINAESARVHLKDGRTRREEFHWGSGFLTQSSRFILLNKNINFAEWVDATGRKTPVK